MENVDSLYIVFPTTFPNIVCLFVNSSALSSVKKNWEVFVFLFPLLAIPTRPRLIISFNPHSSGLFLLHVSRSLFLVVLHASLAPPANDATTTYRLNLNLPCFSSANGSP